MVGQNASYTCRVQDRTNLTFTWMKGLQNISESARISITDETIEPNSGDHTGVVAQSTLTILNITEQDSGTYTCYVSDEENEHVQTSFQQSVLGQF